MIFYALKNKFVYLKKTNILLLFSKLDECPKDITTTVIDWKVLRNLRFELAMSDYSYNKFFQYLFQIIQAKL